MNRKPTWIDKFSDFVTGKGFYLVVLVCVAAIALSGWYLTQSIRASFDPQEDDLTASGSAVIAATTAPSAAPTAEATAQPSVAPTAEPTVEPTVAPTAQPSTAPAATVTPAALVFTWPVKGSLVAAFSVEALAYDETMGDWRTHDGLDISAAQGTQVLATASGTVSALYADELMGTTVVIDHGQGLTSLYAGLASVPTVAVGDQVSTGTVLGSVGDTAVAERGRGIHLHFALYQDEQAVDPEDYLP